MHGMLVTILQTLEEISRYYFSKEILLGTSYLSRDLKIEFSYMGLLPKFGLNYSEFIVEIALYFTSA